MLRTGIPVSQLEREGEAVLATLFRLVEQQQQPDDGPSLHRPGATSVGQLAARTGQRLVDPFAEFGGA